MYGANLSLASAEAKWYVQRIIATQTCRHQQHTPPYKSSLAKHTIPKPLGETQQSNTSYVACMVDKHCHELVDGGSLHVLADEPTIRTASKVASGPFTVSSFSKTLREKPGLSVRVASTTVMISVVRRARFIRRLERWRAKVSCRRDKT